MRKVGKFLGKHKVLFIVLAIILALFLWIFFSAQKIKNQLPIVDTATIEKEDLINSVNVDGVVESDNSKKIFTQLQLPVEENVVEVGDHVKAGDVLGKLDVRTLKNSIEQQRAAAGAQSAIYNNSIELSKKQLEFAQGDFSGGLNAQIVQAEQAVRMAEEQLNQAEVALESSISTLQEYREFSRENGSSKDDPDVQKSSYEAARNNAYASYETAKANLASAKEALAVAQNSVQQQLEGYQDSVKTGQIQAGSTNSQWVTIENMEEDIERAVITSPIDGIVTAVYAVEGSTSTGLLYVVEDLSTLKITASLKEYDLANVKEGNKTVIKSDATGNQEYDGKIEKIAPTTKKTPTGDNLTDKAGEFETTITVNKNDSELRVGSKARVDIIYGKKEQAITVPYEAIGLNAEDKNVVYVLTPSGKDDKVYDVKEVPITIGVEGDFKTEISGEGIKPGDIVIKNSENVPEGMKVHIMADAKELAKEGHVGAYLATMEE